MDTSDKNSLSTDNVPIFDWLSKIIVDNRNITYPMFCGFIDGLAFSIKMDAKKWFDEQGNLINKNSSN